VVIVGCIIIELLCGTTPNELAVLVVATNKKIREQRIAIIISVSVSGDETVMSYELDM